MHGLVAGCLQMKLLALRQHGAASVAAFRVQARLLPLLVRVAVASRPLSA